MLLFSNTPLVSCKSFTVFSRTPVSASIQSSHCQAPRYFLTQRFPVTYFTNLVYLSIRFAVGMGDYAPFVGHNAFLRWKAIQSVSFVEDGVEKFWSDSHVSEDFDISLRLQIAGFIVRLASYDHGEFKEGVSLTVFD